MWDLQIIVHSNLRGCERKVLSLLDEAKLELQRMNLKEFDRILKEIQKLRKEFSKGGK